MATEGFEGFYVETRNYGATAAFWSSLGFEKQFETDHGSGQWEHPLGGPYVFINEQLDGDAGDAPDPPGRRLRRLRARSPHRLRATVHAATLGSGRGSRA